MTGNTNNQAALKPKPCALGNGDVSHSEQALKEKKRDATKNSPQVHESKDVLEARVAAIEDRFETLEGKVDKVLDLLTKNQFPNQNVTVYTSAAAATQGISDQVSMRAGGTAGGTASQAQVSCQYEVSRGVI